MDNSFRGRTKWKDETKNETDGVINELSRRHLYEGHEPHDLNKTFTVPLNSLLVQEMTYAIGSKMAQPWRCSWLNFGCFKTKLCKNHNFDFELCYS